MPSIPPGDHDGSSSDEPARTDGATDVGVESPEAAAARIDAANTRTADWWLAQPPEALRELAEDFERLRGLQAIFGFGACGVLRKKLTRKVDRLFRLTAMAVCDVD
jgi:hypothetical protein